MNEDATQQSCEGIAVIGMAGRFPGATHLRQYWENLCRGVESIVFLSDQELEAAGVPRSVVNDPGYVKAAARLSDVEWFDAGFFGYSAKEATMMDPQQRLFLECAWEALEEAGYAPDACPGSVGVYAGCGANSYVTAYSHRLGNLDGDVLATFLANAPDFLTTRVSYKLNLKGPSLTVQTACSSSLVAVHLACQSLSHGECDMALAGGVSVKVTEIPGYFHQPGGIASPDGHCRAFDARAQGTLFGDGVGVVVLKRVADAIADGDHVYAVVRGSAVNNDGASKVGYTAPSVSGQARVIEEALAIASAPPDTIGYVETHGTGTALGDPVELAALTQAFRAGTDRKQFCAIGSVKTNIGHLDAAAGMASLIKTILMLHDRTLPPSLHFTQPNPEIDFDTSPFVVNTERRAWSTDTGPRRAGVSSFGMGGTNVHMVLEEAPVTVVTPADPDRPVHLLALTARTESALLALAGRYAQYFDAHPETALADVCFTANAGRARFPHRLAVVAASAADMRESLTAVVAGRLPPDSVLARDPVRDEPQIGFLFTGGSAEWIGAARQLYDTHPDFRTALDRCASLFDPKGDASLMAAFSAAPGEMTLLDERSRVLALFAVEYALAELWRSWGVRPAAVMGCGLGEHVAACVAGIFTLDEALRLVASPAEFEIAARAPRVPLVCSRTGRFLDATGITNGGSWREHPQEPVSLDLGIEAMLASGIELILEVGPTSASLAGGTRRLPSLTEGRDGWRQILCSLGKLFVAGVPIDWAGFDRPYPRRRVSLPTYPFERQRYWMDFERRSALHAVPAAAHRVPAQAQSALREQLEHASPAARLDLLIGFVQNEVAQVLGLESTSAVDPQRGFFDLGLESLTALALRSSLERGLVCALPTTFAMNHPTVERLATYLAQHVLGLDVSSPIALEVRPSNEVGDSMETELSDLSEEELAALLDGEVSQILGDTGDTRSN
jgi:acyl transferase domain-containing protein